MSHHGNEPFNDALFGEYKSGSPFKNANISDFLKEAAAPKFTEPLGETGNFPDGKINDIDKGQIRFGCDAIENKVVFNFGKTPIAWIGFTKKEAIDLANHILELAEKITT